jgi:hypothetical protein
MKHDENTWIFCGFIFWDNFKRQGPGSARWPYTQFCLLVWFSILRHVSLTNFPCMETSTISHGVVCLMSLVCQFFATSVYCDSDMEKKSKPRDIQRLTQFGNFSASHACLSAIQFWLMPMLTRDVGGGTRSTNTVMIIISCVYCRILQLSKETCTSKKLMSCDPVFLWEAPSPCKTFGHFGSMCHVFIYCSLEMVQDFLRLLNAWSDRVFDVWFVFPWTSCVVPDSLLLATSNFWLLMTIWRVFSDGFNDPMALLAHRPAVQRHSTKVSTPHVPLRNLIHVALHPWGYRNSLVAAASRKHLWR